MKVLVQPEVSILEALPPLRMLTRFPLLSTVDFAEHRACALRYFPNIVRFDQAEAGPYRGELSVFFFPSTTVSTGVGSLFHSRAVTVETCSPAAVQLVVPTTTTISVSTQGQSKEIAGGRAGFLPMCDFRFDLSAGHYLLFRLDHDRVASTVRELDCDAGIDPILNDLFLDSRLPGLHAVVAQIRQFIAELDDTAGEIIDQPGFRAAHHQLFLIRLADVLATTARTEHRLAAGRNGAALQRAVDYARAHSDGRIDLFAMARYAGVSLRSLQTLFRSNLDCTIVQFIKQHRLAVARGRLESSGPEAPVSKIARQSGFVHLGHFTQAYKAQFGESPGQTLKRSRCKPSD